MLSFMWLTKETFIYTRANFCKVLAIALALSLLIQVVEMAVHKRLGLDQWLLTFINQF
jgi:hypothetical protein